MKHDLLAGTALGMMSFDVTGLFNYNAIPSSAYSSTDIIEKVVVPPSAINENILIVDDENMITEFIKTLLCDEGNVDVAHNGVEALGLIEKKFYKLIISDIDMPEMDGFSLYNSAIAEFPELSSRFLFITGGLTTYKIDFFDRNNVRYLLKPMKINVLKREASKIFLS